MKYNYSNTVVKFKIGIPIFNFPITPALTSSFQVQYSPYSANKNYVMVPGFIQGRPNQIAYIKYPQPVQPARRQYDPQHLPPRTGPVMACHLPCYPEPSSDSEDARDASPPPQYSSNPALYQQQYQEQYQQQDAYSSRPNPYYNNMQDNSQYYTVQQQQELYYNAQQSDNQLPPYPPGGGGIPPNMPSNLQNIPTNLQDISLNLQNIPSNLQNIPTSFQTSMQPGYPLQLGTSLVREDSPTNPASSISVQDRIKKLNQNIASQNNSYKAAVSPKPARKTDSTPAKPEKPEKPAKSKNSEKKPFKMFSPLPRRKAKSQPAPPKVEEEVDKKPNVPSEAVKFILEQKIENLIKETANKRKRRDDFETSIVDYPDHEKANLRKLFAQKESDFLRLKRSKINKDMFTKIKTIGIGSFGEVTLVQKVDTGTLYAMKTLRKAEVWKRNQTAHVKAERDILSEADNEWVVKLHFSFQDKGNLYFVMDYVQGTR